MHSYLKDRFSRLNFFGLGIVFAILFAAMRAVGMLLPLRFGYLVPAGFVLMILLPFVFLARTGRRTMGFTKSINSKCYLYALIAGAGMAFICYTLGVLFFGTSADNWFITIKRFYESNPAYQSQLPVIQLYMFFTIPAMIFSPFGEEIFFRGFLHLSLQEKFSASRSKIIDSVIFAVVHLCHHGLILTTEGMKFFALSGLIWVLLMFSVALIFSWLKEKSQSIYPAIFSHAVFNITMNLTIFYLL